MRHDVRARAALLVVGAALSGCASKPPIPVQRFVLEAPAAPLPSPGPGARVIALLPVRLHPAFLEPSLVYRTGDVAVEIDHYASLAAPPQSMLTAAIRARLLREPIASDVVAGPAGSGGLTLEVVVQELSGDFRRPEAPAGALDLEVSAWAGDPAPGDAPRLRKLYSRREPLPQRSAAAVVSAWSRALDSALKELAADLGAAFPPG